MTRGFRKIKGQGSIHAGLYWSEQVIGLSLGLAIPAVAGVYLDKWLDSSPICTVGGALLGFAVLMLRLIQMVSPNRPREQATTVSPDSASPADLPVDAADDSPTASSTGDGATP